MLILWEKRIAPEYKIHSSAKSEDIKPISYSIVYTLSNGGHHIAC